MGEDCHQQVEPGPAEREDDEDGEGEVPGQGREPVESHHQQPHGRVRQAAGPERGTGGDDPEEPGAELQAEQARLGPAMSQPGDDRAGRISVATHHRDEAEARIASRLLADPVRQAGDQQAQPGATPEQRGPDHRRQRDVDQQVEQVEAGRDECDPFRQPTPSGDDDHRGDRQRDHDQQRHCGDRQVECVHRCCSSGGVDVAASERAMVVRAVTCAAYAVRPAAVRDNQVRGRLPT